MPENFPVLTNFIQSYTNKPYKYPTMVRHQGTVIAFAMAERKIYYSVLNLNAQKESPLDKNYWSDQPEVLEFPSEISAIGFGITDQYQLPLVIVDDNEEDLFKSRTARFTKDAPFQVMSDGRYVYVFRQAIAAGDSDNVSVTDLEGSTVKDSDGEYVSIVDSTLLVDRFVLSGTSSATVPEGGEAPTPKLKLKREVRFRRSRSKTRPQSTKDSLGSLDMDDIPFLEPTQEFSFIRLHEGRFSVLLLPTSVPEILRWQFFVDNPDTGMIDAYNVERSADGLFNTRGSQATTTRGAAETALAFQRPGDHVMLEDVDASWAGEEITNFSQEAWIWPELVPQTPRTELELALIGSNHKDKQVSPSIWIVNNRDVRVGYGDGTTFHSFRSEGVLRPLTWNHLAVVFSSVQGQPEYQLYINGAPKAIKQELDVKLDDSVATTRTMIGAPDNGFLGKIDEIRVWDRARSEREIRQDKHLRLTGQEPGLLAYWRLDEGAGTAIFDQTGNHAAGTVQFTDTPWVDSDAPIGENAGIRRDSFRFDDRKVTTGITSLLYYQQEETSTGYDQQAKPMKRGARVMLAVGTQAEDFPSSEESENNRPNIAVLDFGVGSNGRLAQIPDNVVWQSVAVKEAGQTIDVGEQLNAIKALQSAIAQNQQRIVLLANEIDDLTLVYRRLDNAIENRGETSIPAENFRSQEFNEKIEQLKTYRDSLENGESKVNTLDSTIQSAEITVHKHANYHGHSKSFGLGDVNYGMLRDNHLHDEISSIEIPQETFDDEPQNLLQVLVYEHADKGGHSETFTESKTYIGKHLNDRISFMEVQEHPDVTEYRNTLNNGIAAAQENIGGLLDELRDIRDRLGTTLEGKRADKASLEQYQISYQTEWQQLQSLLNKGISASMGTLHVDSEGLSIAGGLLNFAWTQETPLLFDSAIGNIALYFRGTDDQFFVTYYRTLAQRAQYRLASSLGETILVGYARSTEPEMDRIEVTIGSDTSGIVVDDGTAPPTCTVTIRLPQQATGDDSISAIQETWFRVPLSPKAFARVLNGLAGDRVFVGRATYDRSDQRSEVGGERLLLEAAGLRQTLPVGAILFVGDHKTTLLQGRSHGARELSVAGGLTQLPEETLPLFYLEYDYTLHAQTTQVGADLSNGSRLLAFVEGETDALVDNQSVTSGETLSSQWIAAAPGHTLTFDGENTYVAYPTSENGITPLSQFSPTGDLTLEAWVRPNQIDPRAKQLRVLHYQPATDTGTSYLLGLQAEDNNTAIALTQSGSADGIRIPIESHLNFEGSITLEAWIKPAADETWGNILVHGSFGSAEPQVFLRINDGKYEVGVHTEDKDHKVSMPIPPEDHNEFTWVHLVGVCEQVSNEDTQQQAKYRWQLYRNGHKFGDFQLFDVGALTSNEDWAIGAYPDYTHAPRQTFRSFKGTIAEPRIWKRARTALEIAADMNRELSGYETDLVGYWRFNGNNEVQDYSRYRHFAEIFGAPSTSASPIPAYAAVAGVGGQIVKTSTLFSGGNWNHLAVAHVQAYGVQLDGSDDTYLDAGSAETLNLNQDLTLEVFFQISEEARNDNGTLHNAMGLVTKGTISATEDPEQYVPYALFIYPSGRLGFIFEDVNGSKHLFISQAIADLSEFHKVTVTRKRITETLEEGEVEVYDIIQFYVDDDETNNETNVPYGRFLYREAGKAPSTAQQPTDIGSSNQSLTFGSSYQVSRFDPNGGHWSSINAMYIDDSARDEEDDIYRKFEDPAAAVKLALANDQDVPEDQIDNQIPERAAERTFEEGISISPFEGILSEIRIWNKALAVSNLSAVVQGDQEGLLGWWRFTEAEGMTAYDAVGGSHANLKAGVDWVQDPNPEGSRLLLYSNGISATTEPIAVAEHNDYETTDAQFTLGGVQKNGLQNPFQGDLEEIRIWRTVRTQEQIQDHIFRRLKGEKDHFLGRREDLIAYYPFDLFGADQEEHLSDHSLQGLDLTITNTTYVLSSAPIGEDTPQIRSALAGLRTPFNRLIQSQPAVQEYGDLQSDFVGSLTGAFKRCYSFIVDGKWQLITGFKVGDLVTEWVGQVQFDPQITGYIEGAPPVPGENLTGTGVVLGEFADYNGASSVTFTEANSVTYTFSADRDRGFDFTFESSVGNLTGADVSAGFGLITKVADVQQSFGIKTQFENSLSWLDSASRSDTVSTTLSSAQQLQGYVEPGDLIAYTDVGRRFVTENIGFALVKSRTADVFALRLEHNQALVSYQIRPNPDIPPDRNIINFPLNPTYTKQGTLDGKVAFNADPDYPNALTYSHDSSFYKPREAFALKETIQREAERLQADYDQYEAGRIGRRQGVRHFNPATDLGKGSLLRKLPDLAKRNLVNTYVWTADGGLFSETQETLDVVQETTGGSYSFKGLGGFFLDLKLAIKGVGINWQLEALFGGHMNLQVTKGKESETGFSLDISVDGVERDIYQRDATGDVLFDLSDPLRPKALRHPGRVDAYRFMSFYLEPKPDHFDHFFEQVVDPIWLEQSNDANAISLRSLRDLHQNSDRKPGCWRILHRVTFVSRILPPVGSKKPLPALEKTLQELNIDSNYELIKRLDPFVADKVDNYGEFSRVIRDTIATYLPELQPHIPTIIEFMLAYYGVPEVLQVPDSTELTELLEAGVRASNQAPVVRAGRSRTIELKGQQVTVPLQGAVADDRLLPEAIFVTWAVQSTPTGAIATFDDIHRLATTLTVDRIGWYELSLTASDGSLNASDGLKILVNQAPVVSAGEDFEVGFGESVKLQGRLLRDGRGDRTEQALTTQWQKDRGPGEVSFDNDNALQTRVSFEKSGIYSLLLTAETTTASGILTHKDKVQILVGGRVHQGLQVLYSFAEAEGTQVRDVAGVGVPMPLTIMGETRRVQLPEATIPDALALTEPARLVADNVSRLIEAIKATQEFTLEAWIAPTNAEQPGLARILSLSSGPGARNFVLGQAGNQLYVAIHTRETNANGSDRAFGGGELTADTLTHVVCTRTPDGLTRLYLDGVSIAHRVISGDLSSWDVTFPLILGNERTNSTFLDRAWGGAFHLVAFYDRALSADEVTTNFEVGADANLAPLISAGSDRVVNLPETLTLVGTVTDDRLLASQLSVLWKQSDGPSPVTFSNPESLETTVLFADPRDVDAEGKLISVSGVYSLNLKVGDDEQEIGDEVKLIVNHAPIITLPETLEVQLPNRLSLEAQVESGLGTPKQGKLSFQWAQLSGPGSVTFRNATDLSPSAQFSESGLYRLQLTADNGLFTSMADVTVYANTVPTLRVNAEPLINLPDEAQLQAEVLDTGLANPDGTVVTQWRKLEGPGQVTFTAPNRLLATAHFSQSGIYTLRLTVNNGALTTHRDVTLTVNQAPWVDAGPDQVIDFPNLVELEGTVSDDGFPNPPGRLTLSWSQDEHNEPGTVTFSDPSSNYTTARFSQGGTYDLWLTAHDGAISTRKKVTVHVNHPPVVDAGPDQFLTLPFEGSTQDNQVRQQAVVSTTLVGTVQDDGLPTTESLSLVWEQVDELGDVVLATPNSLTTEATFSAPGTYVLRLSANDGRLTGENEVTVIVSPRIIDGLLALYTFSKETGETIPNHFGLDSTLDLKLKQGTFERLPDGQGITVSQSSLIATTEAATSLTERIQKEQALTVEAWITPIEASPQRIPARIVTLSLDSKHRNFTLGQSNNIYVMRLRTTKTGLNGTDKVLHSGPLTVNQKTHLVYTRDVEGNAVLYLDGKLQQQDLIDGDFSNWDMSYHLGLGNELQKDTRTWLGSYHLVAIYNRALTSEEVQHNFLVGS